MYDKFDFLKGEMDPIKIIVSEKSVNIWIVRNFYFGNKEKTHDVTPEKTTIYFLTETFFLHGFFLYNTMIVLLNDFDKT